MSDVDHLNKRIYIFLLKVFVRKAEEQIIITYYSFISLASALKIKNIEHICLYAFIFSKFVNIFIWFFIDAKKSQKVDGKIVNLKSYLFAIRASKQWILSSNGKYKIEINSIYVIMLKSNKEINEYMGWMQWRMVW